jgi:hypothetical protein
MRKLSTPLSSLAGCAHRGWRADLGRRRLILHAGGCGSDNKAVGGAATSSCGTAHPTRLRCRHVVRQLCSPPRRIGWPAGRRGEKQGCRAHASPTAASTREGEGACQWAVRLIRRRKAHRSLPRWGARGEAERRRPDRNAVVVEAAAAERAIGGRRGAETRDRMRNHGSSDERPNCL